MGLWCAGVSTTSLHTDCHTAHGMEGESEPHAKPGRARPAAHDPRTPTGQRISPPKLAHRKLAHAQSSHLLAPAPAPPAPPPSAANPLLAVPFRHHGSFVLTLTQLPHLQAGVQGAGG